MTDEVLTAAGYGWEEISNWARPGHRCRHNHLYWEQGDYLGIGSAAHSHRDGERWWNVRTPERYIDAVEAGRSPEAGREVLTAGQRAFEALPLAAHAAGRALGGPGPRGRAGGLSSAGGTGPSSPCAAGSWPTRSAARIRLR